MIIFISILNGIFANQLIQLFKIDNIWKYYIISTIVIFFNKKMIKLILKKENKIEKENF